MTSNFNVYSVWHSVVPLILIVYDGKVIVINWVCLALHKWGSIRKEWHHLLDRQSFRHEENGILTVFGYFGYAIDVVL
jgi:hypothetical protein